MPSADSSRALEEDAVFPLKCARDGALTCKRSLLSVPCPTPLHVCVSPVSRARFPLLSDRLNARNPAPPELRGWVAIAPPKKSGRGTKDQGRVRAAEAERVRERVTDFLGSRFEWHQVEVALGVRVVQVEGGGEHTVA